MQPVIPGNYTRSQEEENYLPITNSLFPVPRSLFPILQQIVIKPGTRTPPPTPSPQAMRGLRCTS